VVIESRLQMDRRVLTTEGMTCNIVMVDRYRNVAQFIDTCDANEMRKATNGAG
jgi:hypothetical protein